MRLKPIEGAAGTQTALVEDVGVDHCRPDVAMAEKLLDRSDVGSGLQQVRGEGVAERVAGHALGQVERTDGMA